MGRRRRRLLRLRLRQQWLRPHRKEGAGRYKRGSIDCDMDGTMLKYGDGLPPPKSIRLSIGTDHPARETKEVRQEGRERGGGGGEGRLGREEATARGDGAAAWAPPPAPYEPSNGELLQALKGLAVSVDNGKNETKSALEQPLHHMDAGDDRLQGVAERLELIHGLMGVLHNRQQAIQEQVDGLSKSHIQVTKDLEKNINDKLAEAQRQQTKQGYGWMRTTGWSRSEQRRRQRQQRQRRLRAAATPSRTQCPLEEPCPQVWQHRVCLLERRDDLQRPQQRRHR